MKNKILVSAAIIGSLWILSLVTSFFLSLPTASALDMSDGNTALIPITGVISSFDSGGVFGDDTITSDELIELIDKADSNPSIKAIIFDINSPGGTPVATDEIAQRIKELKKPNVAVIREIGTSGAYWIASSCDYIIANRMSMTGSIGVYGSFLQYSELLERFNVSYERLVAGKYKDIGTPFKNMTGEERTLYQAMLNKLHYFFIQEVAQNRNLTVEKTRELATGMIYLGIEAKELGLVDELGNKDTAKAYLKNRLNETIRITSYKKEPSFFEILSSLSLQKLPLEKILGSKSSFPMVARV
ncbi:MAG: signal peptide peptidase SppA [archaeon]